MPAEPAYIEASARDGVWLVATGAADIYSTAIGLHVCGTCVEGNPILPTAEARIAFKAGYTALAWWGLRKMRIDGHDKAANVLRWCVVGMNLAFTANNIVKMAGSK